jgi:hypothetical protein
MPEVLLYFLLYFMLRVLYYNNKFKRDAKYPCFVVVSQDGFISNPMYYEEAKAYCDMTHGCIKVDRKEYNKLKQQS